MNPRNGQTILDAALPMLDNASDVALELRVFLGVGLVIHGYLRLKGGRRQAEQWMQNMKIPGVTAVFATIIEFFGSLLFIIS